MRASRLLSILILLQLRGRMTAEQLAEEFEVAVRTIYRDIDALSAAGVPVYGESGPQGGFALLDGYRTQLTGIDRPESQALIFAGLPALAAPMGLGAAAKAARAKLLAALSPTGLEGTGRVADRFHLDIADWYNSAAPAQHLPEVARAVFDGHPITMRYEGWRGAHDWVIEPLGIILKGGDWYCIADAREKQRIFKIASIEWVIVGQEHFERPAGFVLADAWTGAVARFEGELRPEQVEIALSPQGAQLLARQGSHAAAAISAAQFVDIDGWRRISMPVESIEQAALMLLGLGPQVRVIAPPQLTDAIVALAKSVIACVDPRWHNAV